MAIEIKLYGDDAQLTWIGADEMYHAFLSYFERMNRLYRDCVFSIQKVDESYIVICFRHQNGQQS